MEYDSMQLRVRRDVGRRLESDVVVPVGGPQSTSEMILRRYPKHDS